MFNRDGDFQLRLQTIINMVDDVVKNAGSIEEDKLKHDMFMIRVNAQTLLHTIQKMSETLGKIEEVEENLKKELTENKDIPVSNSNNAETGSSEGLMDEKKGELE